jgi:biopolymer transport protein ExbB/TolQ
VNLSSFFQHTSAAGLSTLIVLLGCSVYIAALGRDLHLRCRAANLDGDWLLAQLRYLLFSAALPPEQAQKFLTTQTGQPLARIFSELLNLQPPTLEKGDYLLTGLLERERGRLEAGLPSLGTVAVIAPIVGLFGTVVGITKTFADVARLGKAGIEVVSAGVSEALVMTAVGLVVAIVSVVMFNSFKARLDGLCADWDSSGRAFLCLLTSSPREATRLLDSSLSEQPLSIAEEFVRATSLETA